MANEVTDVKIRIQLTNNTEDQVYETREFDGVELNPGGTTPTTDRRILQIVDMSGISIGPDDHLVVFANPISTVTFHTNSEIEIPVTILNTTNKVAKPSVLKRADIFSANVTMTVATWNRIGAFTVARQTRLALGKKIAENSRIRAVVRNA